MSIIKILSRIKLIYAIQNFPYISFTNPRHKMYVNIFLNVAKCVYRNNYNLCCCNLFE